MLARFACAFIVLAPSALLAQQQVPLWPNGAPGFEDRKDVAEVPESFYIRNIHNPSITAYLPPADKANGAAVVIAPGGAHRFVSYNGEGKAPAEFLASQGVAAFVLKYRLARDDKSPFDKYDLDKHPLEDAHRALRLIRSRASEWKIDPKRVGFMGFSAGGEIVSMVAFKPGEGDAGAADPIDRLNGRPDFAIWVYSGPVAIPEGAIPADSPPAFLAVAVDDGATRSHDRIYQKYRDAKLPVEMHVYSKGGHAFGIGAKNDATEALKHWPGRLADWMADIYVLDPAKKEAEERRQRERRERQQQKN